MEINLAFSAYQFSEIPLATLKAADIELPYAMLSREGLRIESEHLLYSFIAGNALS
jgi:hypothetical protein